MKKTILYIIFLVLLIIIISLVLTNRIKDYSKNFFYMDTYINVKISVKNKKNINDIFNKVDSIYNKYQKLTDVYNDESAVSYINNNNSSDTILKIDDDLYKMIELALSYKNISQNKFNINIGDTIKIWKKYRDNNIGLPTLDELKSTINNNDIILLENNSILNNHPSIDLGAISKGYATEEVGKMLEKNGIKSYVINAGGNVLVGKAHNKDYYSIGIENPNKDNDIYQIVKGNNISVVTSGGYRRFFEVDGVRYSHIIDPDTLYPANNCLSVTIISESSAIADILSTTLFLLPYEEGLKLIEKIPNTEAIYYIDDNNIIKSKGFNKYE